MTAKRLKSSTRVTVLFTDPRISSVLVLRQRGAGTPTTVCNGRGPVCLDKARLRPGVYRYEAILADEWGRSDGRFSATVRVQKHS